MALNAMQTSHDDYDVVAYTTQSQNHTNMTANDSDSSVGPASSPFITNVADSADLENMSPNKLTLLRLATTSPVEREREPSPLRLLKSRASPTSTPSSPRRSDSIKSPRKMSDKRFPVKPSISSPPLQPQPQPDTQAAPVETTLKIDDVLRNNEGLTKAIAILEDGDTENESLHAEGIHTEMCRERAVSYEEHSIDDTMISTFSDFSAIPDMTSFAKIGHNPMKSSTLQPTPRRNPLYANTPAKARRPMSYSPSPTPRAHNYEQYSRDDGHTENLLDFTEQFNNFSGRNRQSPSKNGRHSPSKQNTLPDMSSAFPSTPSMNRHTMSNLLDFDIPPAPTPRSMPSITPRELESLKSGFLSEISSLKASLSGKEAEVNSLKTAVGDAEKRVGESMEQVREERDLKEQLNAEKEEWEKRGREMEAVLRNVKEEILHGERERDELEGRLEETERRREAAEVMAQEAESKLAAMRAGKAPPVSESSNSRPGECVCGGRTVEIAVEKVSRELHTLYKDKHETKVAALKKSYERRWDKKVTELENQVEDLTKEIEELRRDATMTRVDPKVAAQAAEDLEKQFARDARAKEMEAELEGLSQVVRSVKRDNSDLRRMLDEERVEKGKLVQAVDEMIPLVAAFDDMLADMSNQPAVTSPAAKRQSNVDHLRGSISKASGLRAPSSVSKPTGESRIGRGGFGMPAGNLDKRNSTLGSRPGSGMGYRSGIMGSIERMGSHKGRGE
ncbi:hypothetical protein HYALB_00007506 [Hymenoscyphus albidus]|uniref:Uncharacterized protein n=1 Tax=Hymenoscyphus albidus TaxID=595503 RepID=A0A9N9LWG4_9HELO|nr:hypothetical protein HYALB_00007506 [Hymenoscyphus albidus]